MPWILADRVNYGITAPWPAAAAGGGASLQRRVTAEFGNDPLNWKADPPTAGRINALAGFAPPVIAAQPQDCMVVAGTSLTLSVGAVGAPPLSYRWQRDGADVPVRDQLVSHFPQRAAGGFWLLPGLDQQCCGFDLQPCRCAFRARAAGHHRPTLRTVG